MISCTHLAYPCHKGLQTSKGEGECSMLGKGIQGGNALSPRCQCKSCTVKAKLPKPQFGGVYLTTMAQGALKSHVGISESQIMGDSEND